ncbi:MAG: microcin ABC transporter permease [Rhodospirillaceae bacterium]|nr:microcin ABC transporter permease [Rhodospirillaceae bacterium]
MVVYIAKRLLLVPITLLAIILVNFVVIQFAPGGPVEQTIAQIQGIGVEATARITGSGGADSQMTESNIGPSFSRGNSESIYRGARGLDPDIIREIERDFGFDKPVHERFFLMLKSYLLFDFGESYFKDQRVVDLVLEKMPVSISLGLWTTLIVYLISIPLGIRKAVRDGSRFDIWSSGLVVIGNAIPGFLFAILLVVIFAGGSFWKLFPIRGLVSQGWEQLSLLQLLMDYLWHMILPVGSMVIGGFAGLTMLTKNSFLEEINKQYVLTAKAKGLSEGQVLYGHVFRNAMLIVIAGFPSAFIGILFTGSLITEIIFSLDGLGLLGFKAAISRDYPVMFGTLYFFTLLGLIMGIIGDIMYVVIDRRIDFESRET